MAKVTLRDLDVANQRVLVRVDYNVPLEERDGRMVITDETRITETIPTIDYLLKHKARVILASHLGRPKGNQDPKQSLKPIVDSLEKLLKKHVSFVDDCQSSLTRAAVGDLKPGNVLLLENLRFHAGEEANDPVFAKSLASLADVYVNDAFGAAHRAHASTEGVAHHVAKRAIGLLMERELKFLGDELANPKRPFVVILGGAKVSDKIQVIDSLLEKADAILIGGAMAYTFALAQGRAIGNSLAEKDQVDTALKALEKANKRGVRFLLPVDDLIVENVDFKERKASAGQFTKKGQGIPEGWQGVDIGPETVKLFSAEIAQAKTLLWNGPMGIFEIPACAEGTFAVARAVADNSSATSIIGGGDSVKAVKKAGVADRVTFISTGGGASLEFLEGKTLPGVAAIPDKP